MSLPVLDWLFETNVLCFLNVLKVFENAYSGSYVYILIPANLELAPEPLKDELVDIEIVYYFPARNNSYQHYYRGSFLNSCKD